MENFCTRPPASAPPLPPTGYVTGDDVWSEIEAAGASCQRYLIYLAGKISRLPADLHPAYFIVAVKKMMGPTF